MKEKLVERFKNKGNNLADKNIKAIEEGANSCLFIEISVAIVMLK